MKIYPGVSLFLALLTNNPAKLCYGADRTGHTPSTVSVSAAIKVIDTNEINYTPINWIAAGAKRIIDQPLVTFTQGNNRYWLNFGGGQAMFLGSLEKPFTTVQWIKSQKSLFSDSTQSNGTYWITNIYQHKKGLLAFIHVEHNRIVDAQYHTGHGRIGLAWSSDFGNNFTYLGNIIIPHNDPDDFNAQGVPYLIIDGYFYIYYTDNCSNGKQGVSRALVSDVIADAIAGKVSSWFKYKNGEWNSIGLGGDCSSIPLEAGITHTDAAYSTFSGKYYLLLTRLNWNKINSWIKIYESTDGISWVFSKTIAEIPSSSLQGVGGYQYASIVDESGSDNGVVGQRFFVYSGFLSDENWSAFRWLIDLDGKESHPTTYDAISGYSSHPDRSNTWQHLYKIGDTYTPMAWLPTVWDSKVNIWTGDTSTVVIGSGWMHPSAGADASLMWTAPADGNVLLTGKVSDGDGSCGDGVVASVHHGKKTIWKQIIENNDSAGKIYSLSEHVLQGDKIYFNVNKRNDHFCDSTKWNPVITYTVNP